MDMEKYQNPIGSRYASKEMLRIFSEQHKITIWRTIWTELARAEMELGCCITPEQISEMRENQEKINFQLAAKIESDIHHDVMAHVKTYCTACPLASPIIHLGATSNDITDNADVVIQREAMDVLIPLVAGCLAKLTDFIEEHQSLVTVAYTHYQPAQATTYGKRACLWAQDLMTDLEALEQIRANLKFKGFKGATGSQDSYRDILGGIENVKRLDNKLAHYFGFDKICKVTGQTYSRKQDITVVSALASLGASVHKMCTDIRLLAHDSEVSEPFYDDQVGSSAMPYKKNPILSERCCSLSRHLISLSLNPLMTLSTQWIERSLDDSANRRITLTEAFIVADSVLNTLKRILEGMRANKDVIEKRLKQHIQLMAAEKILMEAVMRGGDRQECHGKLRECSLKADGLDFLTLVGNEFPFVREKVSEYSDPSNYIGCIPQQINDFLEDLHNILRRYGLR